MSQENPVRSSQNKGQESVKNENDPEWIKKLVISYLRELSESVSQQIEEEKNN